MRIQLVFSRISESRLLPELDAHCLGFLRLESSILSIVGCIFSSPVQSSGLGHAITVTCSFLGAELLETTTSTFLHSLIDADE
jgi:hypothetical protein